MNKKKLIVPIIVLVAIASFWIFVVLNEMAQHDADNEVIQRKSLNSLPKALDTTICKNAISNLVDVASRINPIPENVARSMNISSIPKEMAIKMNLIPGDVITEELLKQKNNATLTALNNCGVESLTMEEIGQLLSWGKENE